MTLARKVHNDKQRSLDQIKKLMLTIQFYRDMEQGYLDLVISGCVKSGQFYFVPDKFVLLYWLIHSTDIKNVCDKVIPTDTTTGDVLYIVECVSCDREEMQKAVREMRKVMFDGLFWHRNNNPVILPMQKGGMI